MKRHLSNAAHGLLDYAAYPAIMLIAAPALLRHLGIAAYGVWLIANAAAGAGSVVSSGFGDAVIQRVAVLRARQDIDTIRKVVANMLAINLMLGVALALLLWSLIPYVAGRITHFDPSLRTSIVWSLRAGSILIVLKSIESVFICTQRAFERYASAVMVSVATRILTTLLCVLLAWRGYGVPSMIAGTCVMVVAGTGMQAYGLRHLGGRFFRPSLDRTISRDLSAFGAFSWLQAMSGMLFSQADRLLLGITLGASAVSCYGISVQLAQPIHGMTAACLHFIFPHLSRRFASNGLTGLRRPILLAMGLNALMAFLLTTNLIVAGPALLARWMGPSVASQSAAMMPVLAASFGLLAMNVTAHYALLAFGRVQLVTALNIAGGMAMMCAMKVLVHSHGAEGAAVARLFYGPITCLLYVPLLWMLRKPTPAIALPHIALEEA